MADIEAIVLHQIDYRDNSKILYLYSAQGHLNVLAHGVKKMNSVNRFLSQTGTVIRCRLTSSKQLPSLQDGELLQEFSTIKQDAYLYAYMSHILELTRHTIADDLDHAKMYQFLLKLFECMNQGSDPELLSFIFELKLLYFLGHGLHIHGCTQCDDPEDLVFYISGGGLICRRHLHPSDTWYDAGIYQQLIQLYYLDIKQQPLPEMSANDRVIIRHIIDLLFEEFVGFTTKSRNILKQLKKY